MEQARIIVLNPKDNVAVALTPLVPGETLAVTGGELASSIVVGVPIPVGHKIALCDLVPGQTAIKYGQPIGKVTQPIRKGEHVHVHNLDSTRAA
jgi:altronate dehydratase